MHSGRFQYPGHYVAGAFQPSKIHTDAVAQAIFTCYVARTTLHLVCDEKFTVVGFLVSCFWITSTVLQVFLFKNACLANLSDFSVCTQSSELPLVIVNSVRTVAPSQPFYVFGFFLPDKMTHHCTKFSGHWKVSLRAEEQIHTSTHWRSFSTYWFSLGCVKCLR